MKGFYTAIIVLTVVVGVSSTVSAQGSRNGVANGQANGMQNGAGNDYQNGKTNGMGNGVGNGSSAGRDMVMKGSKIVSNVYYEGSANGGVWKTTNGGPATQTIRIRAIETERDPDRRSMSYMYRIVLPATQEIEVKEKPKTKRSKP